MEAAVKSSILNFALTCLIGASLAACSSSSSDGGSTDGGKDTATGGGDTAGGGTDTAGGGTDTAGGSDTKVTTDSKPPPGDGGGGGDDACGAETTNNKCQSCCATNHMDAYNAFATALLTCACKDGNCKTQCETEACASPPAAATATCTKCLGDIQAGACKADLDACKAAACAPFIDCAQTQCAGKT
jgi:hypothetical protein